MHSPKVQKIEILDHGYKLILTQVYVNVKKRILLK